MFKLYLMPATAIIAVLLAATAVVNLKISGKRADLWSQVLRTLMLLVFTGTACWTAYSTTQAGTSPAQWPTFWGLLYLLGLLLLCASFFAEYYIRYRKRKDDPAALAQMVKRGLETILCAVFLSAMGIVHLMFF